jgi:hypothetical protein
VDPGRKAPISFPVGPTHLIDPPHETRELREQGALCPLRFPDGHVGWLVARHELAKTVFRDPRFSMLPARMPFGVSADEIKEMYRHPRELAATLLRADPRSTLDFGGCSPAISAFGE